MRGCADEERKYLKEEYDKIIDLAEYEFDQTEDEYQKCSLFIAIDGSWDIIGQITERIDDLDDEDKSRVYHLFREVLAASSRVYGARLQRIEKKKGNSNGGVRREISAAIEVALDAELARCPPNGPVDLGRVADELREQGIPRGWQSLYRQLLRRGVVLPTTSKRQVSPARRQPLRHD